MLRKVQNLKPRAVYNRADKMLVKDLESSSFDDYYYLYMYYNYVSVQI